MEEDPNAPRYALPQLPRPVFISYARRDFRIAYHIWQQMLSPSSTASHDEQVLMDFPPLTPADIKLLGYQFNVSTADHPMGFGVGYEDDWSPGMPGWMVAIGANLIKANSLVVVVTPNSKGSEAVDIELKAFEAFPNKPIALLTVNRTPIPDNVARYERAMVHDITIDIKSMMGNLLREAFKAQSEERWLDTGLFFTEAIQLLPLFKDASQELCIDLCTGRGRADMHLGYREQAVQMYTQALNLLDREQHHSRSKILYSLGWAHATEARNEVGRSRKSLVNAQNCWQLALATIDQVDSSYDKSPENSELHASCQKALLWATRMLETDHGPVIAITVQAAGQAEQEGNWTTMREHYSTMFHLYRLGQERSTAIAADMLSAKARAERRLGTWDDARITLEYALEFVGEEDTASRAGLLHDLGCVHSKRVKGFPTEDLTRKQLSAAGRCWSEARTLAGNLADKNSPDKRYDYAGLARSCDESLDWLHHQSVIRPDQEYENLLSGTDWQTL